MRLDAATSLTDPERFAYRWTEPHMARDFSAHDLFRILDRNRYEGAVLSTLTDHAGETEWLLEQKAQHAWIKGVIGAPVSGVCGVRRRFDELDAPVDSRLPIDLIITPDQLARAPEAIGGRRVALVNLGGATYTAQEFASWSAAMRPLAALPNVVVKISGLINEAGGNGWNSAVYRPYVQLLLREFGPRRLMYGSDWPNCMKTGTWKESLAAFTQALGAQPQETRDWILGQTAASFYGV